MILILPMKISFHYKQKNMIITEYLNDFNQNYSINNLDLNTLQKR